MQMDDCEMDTYYWKLQQFTLTLLFTMHQAPLYTPEVYQCFLITYEMDDETEAQEVKEPKAHSC